MKKIVSRFALLLVLSFVLVSIPEARIVKAPPVLGAIRIMPSGTVEGTDKIQRNGDIYTLTGDINGYLNDTFGALSGFLLVIKDNIVIDGAGHTIQGNGTGVGIFMRSMHNVTIKNFNINGFVVGISFYVMDPTVPPEYPIQRGSALNNQILNNNITAVDTDSITVGGLGGWGIYVEFANNTVISGNTITSQNPQKAIYCGSGCYNTTFLNNKFIGCGLRLFRVGQNNILNNTIDGKPIVHFDGVSNQVIDGVEQVFLFNCSNMTIKNVHPSANYRSAIQVEETRNSEVTNCGGNIVLTNSNSNTIHKNSPNIIALVSSDYNRIFGNTILNGEVIFPKTLSDYEYSRMCIQIFASAYNDVYGNNLLNSHYGIQVGDVVYGESQHNNIYLNNIANVGSGVYCPYGSDNAIYANNITDCGVGISLERSSQNRIFQNNITDCSTGIKIWESNNNAFYHNNFIDNVQHVFEQHESLLPPFYRISVNNTWDAGYPTGGNYWSDYNGTDLYGGPFQNETGGDGIGDTPYIVYENKTDHYPIMNPIPIPEFLDTTPPTISIVSPENKTYTANNVPLTFTVSKPTSWIGYSLDGQENVTISGNTTLTGLSDGSHNLTVYAKDTAGNTGSSKTIYFSIAQKKEPEQSPPFPTTWIVTATVIIAMVGAALLVYFNKIRKTPRKAE